MVKNEQFINSLKKSEIKMPDEMDALENQLNEFKQDDRMLRLQQIYFQQMVEYIEGLEVIEKHFMFLDTYL